MIARFNIRHRLSAWLALAGLLIQIGVTVAHTATHLDHLIGRLAPADHQVAAPQAKSASPLGAPAAPATDSCPLDFGLILSGTYVAPEPGQPPVPVVVFAAAPAAPEPVFVLATARHSLPLARAPPVFAIVV